MKVRLITDLHEIPEMLSKKYCKFAALNHPCQITERDCPKHGVHVFVPPYSNNSGQIDVRVKREDDDWEEMFGEIKTYEVDKSKTVEDFYKELDGKIKTKGSSITFTNVYYMRELSYPFSGKVSISQVPIYMGDLGRNVLQMECTYHC